jgi:hypothetical protein
VSLKFGTERIINFESVLHGYSYAPLRERNFFNQVRLDPEVHTLVWPNGADVDPATLYNWHQGMGESWHGEQCVGGRLKRRQLIEGTDR